MRSTFIVLSAIAFAALIGSDQLSIIVKDDFDGTTLSPRWKEFSYQPGHWQTFWEHKVSDGWLTITNVWGTKDTNFLWLSNGTAAKPELFDFSASVKVKWEEDTYQGVFIGTGESWPPFFAVGMGYRVYYPNEPQIIIQFTNWGGGAATFPAPPPGEHVFTIKRIGDTVYAYVDDVLYYESKITYAYSVKGISLAFAGPKDYNPDFKPLSVDWVWFGPAK